MPYYNELKSHIVINLQRSMNVVFEKIDIYPFILISYIVIMYAQYK